MLALTLTLVAVALVWRIATVAAPPPHIRRTLAAYIRLPGRAPALAWPHEGEAIVEVQGVAGTIASWGRQVPVPIASVAKVMTAYLTLLEHPLQPKEQGFVLTITPANVAEEQQRVALDQSTLPVRSGEQITEREALQALLLPSANNIAALLAEHAGGAAAFVARMNATARRLGMSATTYTDPSGFTPSTVSTAADQLKLARAAMRVPAFAELVDERSATLPVAGKVTNYNELVGQEGYVGVKTGSDSAAGGCLMFAKRALLAGQPLMVLGVVLGQRGSELVEAALASARRLGNSVATSLHVQTALPAGSRVLSISDADGQQTTAVTASALNALGWGGIELPVSMVLGAVGSHLRAGARVGTVTLGGTRPVSTAVVITRALAGPSLGWRLSHLF